MVNTLDPTVTSSGGAFNGEGVSFPPDNQIEVWYKYGKGTSLPATPLESTHQTVIALSGTTPIASFGVSDTCTDFAYQVSLRREKRSIGRL